ncbi:MAG TPA: hypothetical protein PKW33_09265 [Anaerolineaceae bacterium]|nr:hypothetical protein [Anaerolineaceae bacterium]HPN51764.1 hypothetical protein [Anaerolineaceae bacterium]
MTDILLSIVGFILTLMVLSYLVKDDNALFHLAAYIFVGVSAGFVTLLILTQVLWPQLTQPFIPLFSSSDQIDRIGVIWSLVTMLLGALLLLKISPRLSRFGMIPVAFLVGAGAAIIIGGAVFGTILPQIQGAADLMDLKAGADRGVNPLIQMVDAVILIGGTICTLFYFYFGAKPRPNQPPQRSKVVETLGTIGQIFVGITLGALFAGVFTAALTALVERGAFIWNFIWQLIGG